MAFVYSLFIAISSLIYETKFNSVLKITIHMLSHIVFFGIDFIYFGGYYKNGISAFYIILIFIFVYIVISLISFGLKKLVSLASPKNEEYKSAFKG